MRLFKKLSLLCSILTISISSIVFGAEHHTSWNGDPNVSYEIINNDIPYFTEQEKANITVFEIYSPLDELGRCGQAYANLCVELMPTKKREDISKVYPSGWKFGSKSNNNKYPGIVKGNYIYNRSHLIAHSLAGEDANKENLITGTYWMNHSGMYEEAEKDVLNYIKRTNNHVLYRVTPIFEGTNLICEGVRIEAYSVEDQGKGICFNRFYYNVQPGIEINYATGENWIPNNQQLESESTSNVIVAPIDNVVAISEEDIAIENSEDYEEETYEEVHSENTNNNILSKVNGSFSTDQVLGIILLIVIVGFACSDDKKSKR